MLSSQKLEDYTTDPKKNLTWHILSLKRVWISYHLCVSWNLLYKFCITSWQDNSGFEPFICLFINKEIQLSLLRWFVLLHSELRIDKTRLYNFSKVKKDRRWLKVLENFWVIFLSLSSTSSLFISLQSVRAVRKS